ncbi:MAG: PP2C family protein-serine/threonine phosphatase, partial [Bacteroidetes bacterium]|nr:PP2C family protein-serine/threonine phosphatase [Bacteroidota bacterium]
NKIRFFFKLYFIDKLIGILCLGEKLTKKVLSKNEILFIETMLNLSSPTIENSIRFDEIRKLNLSLSSQIQHLRTLFELSKEFNTNFQDRSKILRLLKYSLLGNFGIKDYIIFSKFRADKFYILEAGKEFSLDDEYISQLELIKEPEILADEQDSPFRQFMVDSGYRLLLPITTGSTVDTIVCLGGKLNKSEYTITDIQFLESLINLCIISLDNTVLFNEYIDKQKIENELKIARDIQLALLPSKVPVIKGYSVSGCNIPALQVGGDYYDVIKLCETKYCFVIADVSGKGTPASLLMANIQSAVHSFLKFYDDEFSLEESTQKINEMIFQNTSSEKFITFFWGILDVKDNSFKYVNAGHNFPYLVSGEGVQGLDKGGLMLGVLDAGPVYGSGTVEFRNGDVLVMYTDGASEARNADKDEYGEEQIKEVVKANRGMDAEGIQKKLLDDIAKFTEGETQYDDITLIVVKRG